MIWGSLHLCLAVQFGKWMRSFSNSFMILMTTYSMVLGVVRVSLLTLHWRNSAGVLTRELLAAPQFSIGSLLKRLSMDYLSHNSATTKDS